MSLKITPNRTAQARLIGPAKTGAKGPARGKAAGAADAADTHTQDGYGHDQHDETPKRPQPERSARGPALAAALAQPAGNQALRGVRQGTADAALTALARRVLDAYAHAPASRQAEAHGALAALR